MGQIGKGLGRGYICQNVLAVAAETGEVLGLVDQILHHRDEVPDDETLTAHRERATRESRLWLRGTEHLPARLEPAIALLSEVAVTRLNLRDASRHPDATTRRATTVGAAGDVDRLSLWRDRKIKTI